MSVREVSCVWLCWPRAVQITSEQSRLYSTISKHNEQNSLSNALSLCMCVRLLSSMLQTVCRLLSDNNQVVRSAALFALGQFSEHLQVRLKSQDFFFFLNILCLLCVIIHMRLKLVDFVSYSQTSVNSMLS